MRYKSEKPMIKKGKLLDPSIIIGKNGVTEEVIKEIKGALNRKNLIKIKMLGSCIKNKDKKELARKVAEETGSELIHMTGFVFILYKKH